MSPYKSYFLAGAVFSIGTGSLLLYGSFLFLGSFSLINLGFGSMGSLLFDTCLSILFFLQHSLLVRKSVRGRFTQYIPDVLYPAFYTITSGIALFLAIGLWQEVPHIVTEASGISNWVLRGLFFAAIGGFIWGTRSLDSFDPYGIKGIFTGASNKRAGSKALIVRGAYQWMRHPLYFFSMVMIWVCPVVTSDRLLFNILWTMWIVIGALFEERDMIKDFGEDYRKYQSRVPMLIPYRIPKSDSLNKPG